LALLGPNDLAGQKKNAKSDRRFDWRSRDVNHSQRSKTQGDGMCDGKGGYRYQQYAPAANDQDQGQHEQQMVVAEQDVLNTVHQVGGAAADNLRIAKILVQMGLDPNNITYDALFNRMLEIVLANITLASRETASLGRCRCGRTSARLGAKCPARRSFARPAVRRGAHILVIEPVVLKQALDFEQLGEDGIAVDHLGDDR
jgi:hypothetical protein